MACAEATPRPRPFAVSIPSTGRHAVRSTVLVFVGTGVANMALLIASAVAARVLGPSDFAAIGAMLAILLILSIMPFALVMVIARDVATAGDTTSTARASRFRLTHRIALSITVVGLAISAPLAAVLEVPVMLVALTTASAYPLIAVAVPRGMLQGREDFLPFALNLAVEGIVRLAAVVAILALGGGVVAVGVAPLIATTAALLLGLHQVRPIMPTRALMAAASEPWDRRLIGVTALYGGLFALTNADLLFAKARLAATAAGEYAVAALFGKIVFFLPVAVGAILVPTVARKRAQGSATLPALGWSCSAVGAACLAITALATLWPVPVRMVLGGPAYAGADDLFAAYGLAMTALALASVMGSYLVAMAREQVGWAFLAATAVAWVALATVAATPASLIGSLVVVSVILSAAAGYFAVRSGRADVKGRHLPL